MGAKHLGGAFFREERLQDEHLSEADTHNSEGDEDTPDHCSLIQIFCSVPPLGFPQPVVGLIVDHSVHVFVHFSCRGFHLKRKVSKYSERVTDITNEQTVAVLSYRVSL